MKYFYKIPEFKVFPGLDKIMLDLLRTKGIEWGMHNQICINTVPDRLDDYQYGTGSLDLDWSNPIKEEGPLGTKITVNKRQVPLLEEDFTEVCTQFKGTEFEEIYQMVSKKYITGRMRLMKMMPKTCLSWHTDFTKRIHLPIITSPGCRMVIDDEVIHLDTSSWWYTETNNPHTAFNGSFEPRVHLVTCVFGEK